MKQFMTRSIYRVLPCLALFSIAGTAWAHHSFAAYNMAEIKTVSGTLKQFRWGAPHSSLVMYFQNEKGEREQMSIISGSPLMFKNQGFNPRDFKSGEEVTVTYHPNVNGNPGGALSTLKLPNGQIFSDTESAGSAPPGATPPPASTN